MNDSDRQIAFGLRLRKEFAESYNCKSWEEFIEKYNERLVAYLEEMVECASELHILLTKKEVQRE